MKIAIVEDDIQMYEHLQTCLYELLGSSAEYIYFPSGEFFLQTWQPGTFELIILDIFMDRLTGMDVAREIRKSDREVRLVFSTTSNEFASESYEVNACYYLLKPFGKDRVKAMLDRIDLAQLEKMRTVQLPDGTTIVLRDIIYADYAAVYPGNFSVSLMILRRPLPRRSMYFMRWNRSAITGFRRMERIM